jgi:hypothetical protein
MAPLGARSLCVLLYESWIMSSGERIIPIIPARWLTVENVPNITVEMTNQSSRVYSKVSNRAI